LSATASNGYLHSANAGRHFCGGATTQLQHLAALSGIISKGLTNKDKSASADDLAGAGGSRALRSLINVRNC